MHQCNAASSLSHTWGANDKAILKWPMAFDAVLQTTGVSRHSCTRIKKLMRTRGSVQNGKNNGFGLHIGTFRGESLIMSF